MPEQQDKKISYKILTAEELLKEEAPPAKEIKHEEEKIEVPVTEKIETEKLTTPPVIPSREIKEKKEVVKPQIETGLVYPEEEKPKEIPLPEIKEIKEVVFPKAKPIPVPEKPIEPQPIERIEEIKEPIAEEIFYKPAKERETLKPKLEILKEEPKEEAEIKKQAFKLPSNLLKYGLIGSGIILVIGLIIFFKPYEKLKTIFVAKEKPKPEEEIKITTPTPTTIIFPTTTATSISAAASPTTETTTETITETKPTSTLPTSVISVSEEIPFLKNFPSKEISVQELNFQSFQKEINNFFAKQELIGTKFNLNLIYNQKSIPFNFIFDYFLKPTKVSTSTIESFKNELTGNYGFLLYYGYVRKYPILIFEIKDSKSVEKFNQQWEKLSMKDDLKTLFLGNEPPPTKNNFVTKKIDNLSYRILDFGNNYKIIWTIINNYLIYSTTETGLKEIISYLKWILKK